MSNLIIFTDIGRDVDDALALVYAQGCRALDIKGVITTHGTAHKQAMIASKMLSLMGNKKTKVAYGSAYPLQGSTLHIGGYEGEGILESDESVDVNDKATDFLLDIVRKNPGINITVLAPFTDLAKAILLDKEAFEKIGGLYIMGGCSEKNGRLHPHYASYNIRMDKEAAEIVFDMQDKVPMYFMPREVIYSMPLKLNDFEEFSATEHVVGKYLKYHSIRSHEYFKTNVPELYERIYKDKNHIAYPYDPLTIMMLSNPELFAFKEVGRHKIATEVNVNKAKKMLVETIVGAL